MTFSYKMARQVIALAEGLGLESQTLDAARGFIAHNNALLQAVQEAKEAPGLQEVARRLVTQSGSPSKLASEAGILVQESPARLKDEQIEVLQEAAKQARIQTGGAIRKGRDQLWLDMSKKSVAITAVLNKANEGIRPGIETLGEAMLLGCGEEWLTREDMREQLGELAEMRELLTDGLDGVYRDLVNKVKVKHQQFNFVNKDGSYLSVAEAIEQRQREVREWEQGVHPTIWNDPARVKLRQAERLEADRQAAAIATQAKANRAAVLIDLEAAKHRQRVIVN